MAIKFEDLSKKELIYLVNIYEQNTEQIVTLIRNTIFACTMLKMDLIGFRKRVKGGSND